MAITVFHTTTDPASILAAGFVNGDGTTGLGAAGRVGVMLCATPQVSSAGLTLAVDFPDAVDLSSHAISEGAKAAWCVPAELVNSTATVRLLSRGEVDCALDGTSGPESRRR